MLHMVYVEKKIRPEDTHRWSYIYAGREKRRATHQDKTHIEIRNSTSAVFTW